MSKESRRPIENASTQFQFLLHWSFLQFPNANGALEVSMMDRRPFHENGLTFLWVWFLGKLAVFLHSKSPFWPFSAVQKEITSFGERAWLGLAIEWSRPWPMNWNMYGKSFWTSDNSLIEIKLCQQGDEGHCRQFPIIEWNFDFNQSDCLRFPRPTFPLHRSRSNCRHVFLLSWNPRAANLLSLSKPSTWWKKSLNP